MDMTVIAICSLTVAIVSIGYMFHLKHKIKFYEYVIKKLKHENRNIENDRQ